MFSIKKANIKLKDLFGSFYFYILLNQFTYERVEIRRTKMFLLQ